MRREQGSALIVALVALAAIGLFYVYLHHMFGDMAEVSAKTVYKSERAGIRQMLEGAVDCNQSLQPGVCPGGGFRTLYRKRPDGSFAEAVSGDPAQPTRLGRWALRAECSPGSFGFVVRATRLAPTGRLDSTDPAAFLADPVTKAVTTWSDAASIIYDATTPLCYVHTEANAAGSPTLATRCDGQNAGGWCSRPYYADIQFARPFDVPPRVIVAMAQPLVQGNDCTAMAGARSTDRNYGVAENVTTTGFRMRCGSSPLDWMCPGVSYAGWWLMSRCQWIALDP